VIDDSGFGKNPSCSLEAFNYTAQRGAQIYSVIACTYNANY